MIDVDKSPELRERILEAAAATFNAQGVRMKMEDVAKAIAISKKTIYTVFPDKEALLSALIEEGFRDIKEKERLILSDDRLDTLEKIRRVVIAMPESLQKVDFKQFHEVAVKYPKLFKAIEARIEGEWEPTLALLEQGMAEGVIRPMPTIVFKLMIEASIEHFLNSQALAVAELSYFEALEAMMDLLVEGMRAR